MDDDAKRGSPLATEDPSVAVCSASAYAAPPEAVSQLAPPFNRAPLDTALQAFVDRGQISGVVAIVFKDGHEVYFGAFGYADREAQRPMSRDGLFSIHSLSKPVTGVALMQLYDQGRFQLDDPLERYLPEFADMKVHIGEGANGASLVEPARRPITVRDLTRHTAGLGSYGSSKFDHLIKAADPMNWQNTLPEMVRRIASLPLSYHPGEKWLYSAAVDVQAYLVEKLSGVAYEQYAMEHVLSPLGMADTSFYVEPARQARRVPEYHLSDTGVLTRTPDEAVFRFSSAEWPLDPGGFGWTSTIDDYAKFTCMLLGEGEFGGAHILKPETVRLMATNQLDNEITDDHWLPNDGITARSWLPNKGQLGFGIDCAVRLRPPVDAEENPGEVGEFFWFGRDSELFWVDPMNDLTAVLMVQLIPFDRIGLHRNFRRAVYAAIAPVARGSRPA